MLLGGSQEVYPTNTSLSFAVCCYRESRQHVISFVPLAKWVLEDSVHLGLITDHHSHGSSPRIGLPRVLFEKIVDRVEPSA
jgi:hypothetical protein